MTKKSGGLLLEKDKITETNIKRLLCGANFFIFLPLSMLSYMTLLVVQFQFQVKVFSRDKMAKCVFCHQSLSGNNAGV